MCVYVFEFVQELLVHSHRPPGIFAWFPLSWATLLLNLEQAILKYQPAFWFTSSFQVFIPQYAIKQNPEEVKVCSPKIQGTELTEHPPSWPKDFELHHSMVTAAQTAKYLWKKAKLK